nr:ADP-ribosylation factor GTPase-activating protein 2-like [Microcebus murinus]
MEVNTFGGNRNMIRGIDRKKEEKKLQNLEGKKREQAERLGMGLVSRSSVSHSVLSEMQVIEQETPVSAKSSRSQLDLFDDVGTFASGPPKYKDNPFSLGESFGSRWDTDAAWGMDRVEEKEPEVTISSIRPISERATNRREVEGRTSGLESSEARQKFAGAKAISSGTCPWRRVVPSPYGPTRLAVGDRYGSY